GTQIIPYEYDDISKNDFGYLAIKLIEDDKHWFKFNDKGSIIEQGIEETEIEDDYNSGWDNSPSIYDNPYYNDNLDMDQQSIDFWNSL
ncbi:MAG: hypothetical protein J1E95_11630, partial [Muribaculaceae bacterium]|nr:hypothetical protein [Muribaculaceae bacterium]